ncbi:MAG: hypothetical protein AB7V16_10415 [Vulcanibacillus sp.]
MELYLQYAYGMKQLSIDLSNDWNGTTVILSPRDISAKQLQKWQRDFTKANIKTLFDPQCYFPKTNHKVLSKYEYWDNSFSTKLESNQKHENRFIESIYKYNEISNTIQFIIPATMLKYDEDWFSRWKTQCESLIIATENIVRDREHILTIAIPSNFLVQREDEIEKIISVTEEWDVDGYYIIAEPPEGQYLVDRPLWLSNLMQICAGLKLQEKKVIMGYANHQLLCLTATKIDALATGTYLNVRHFTNKFEDEDSTKRKSTWYYYPAALSEYKIGFLDTAYSNGILNQMKPSIEMDNHYVDILFSGAMPSSTVFNETMAFKHYLNCLRIQIRDLSKKTFIETINANEVLLETAMRRIEFLEKNGVYAQTRSFRDIVDVNNSALQRLKKNRGPQLQFDWKLL